MDGGCMAVGNVDNEPGGSMKIVVGSFAGILRIFKPSQKDYRAEDLKLEQSLGAPILQVEMGIFHSCSQKDLQLAVLHPKRLSVYGVSSIPGEESSGGSGYQLSLLYKHNLERSAYNFTFGPFGKVQGKDYIAVQSLDGELTVIEQENMAFSKFLPNFLVPGPLCYAPAPLDAFITVNSQFECECYRYGPLSATAGGLLATGDDRNKESRRPRPEWCAPYVSGSHPASPAIFRMSRNPRAYSAPKLADGTLVRAHPPPPPPLPPFARIAEWRKERDPRQPGAPR